MATYSTIIINPAITGSIPTINFTNTNSNTGNINLTATGTLEVCSGASAGNLSLKTNNADRVYILNNGNIGIGKTNPAYALDVNGPVTLYSSGGKPAIKVRATIAGNVLTITDMSYNLCNTITYPNVTIYGGTPNIPSGTLTIINQTSGNAGGIGTYMLNSNAYTRASDAYTVQFLQIGTIVDSFNGLIITGGNYGGSTLEFSSNGTGYGWFSKIQSYWTDFNYSTNAINAQGYSSLCINPYGGTVAIGKLQGQSYTYSLDVSGTGNFTGTLSINRKVSGFQTKIWNTNDLGGTSNVTYDLAENSSKYYSIASDLSLSNAGNVGILTIKGYIGSMNGGISAILTFDIQISTRNTLYVSGYSSNNVIFSGQDPTNWFDFVVTITSTSSYNVYLKVTNYSGFSNTIFYEFETGGNDANGSPLLMEPTTSYIKTFASGETTTGGISSVITTLNAANTNITSYSGGANFTSRINVTQSSSSLIRSAQLLNTNTTAGNTVGTFMTIGQSETACSVYGYMNGTGGPGNTVGSSSSWSYLALSNGSVYLTWTNNSFWIGGTNSVPPNAGTNNILQVNGNVNIVGGLTIQSGQTVDISNVVIKLNSSSTAFKTVMYDISNSKMYYSASAKTFVILHPTTPTKYLVHACLEGPESGVYYRGKGEIVNNENTTVQLPDYVDALATDFTVQITPICNNHNHIPVYGVSEVENNQFVVYGPTGKFYWLVQGKRGEIEVEPDISETKVNGTGPYRWI